METYLWKEAVGKIRVEENAHWQVAKLQTQKNNYPWVTRDVGSQSLFEEVS